MLSRSASSLKHHDRSRSRDSSENRQQRDSNTVKNLETFGLLHHQKSSLKLTRQSTTRQHSSQPSRRATFAVQDDEPIQNDDTFDRLGQERAATRANSTRDRAKVHLGYASRIREHWLPPLYGHPKQTSLNWRSGHPAAGMMEVERSRTRRERTFIGSECAVCEEPLEHTLRGERILQFSCGHVSHEACFYEYIKEIDSQYCPTCNAPLGLDTSRGGNVLDLEKLSTIVRSVAQSNMNETHSDHGHRSSRNTPTPPGPWDQTTIRDNPRDRDRDNSVSRSYVRDSKDSQMTSYTYHQSSIQDRYDSNPHQSRHKRKESAGTSSHDYEQGRRHDYDVDAMETDLSSPRASLKKNPIPPPQATVRSEYPTLTRSKQPQTLTCLVTVEVPEGKWRPNPEDLRPPPPLPNIHEEEKEVVVRPTSLEEENNGHEWEETPQELEEITEDLRERVENWHGLDFSRFGKLSRHGTLQVSRDRSSWQELECFLFAEMLICIKERRGAVPVYADGNSKRKLTKCTLRGSILIKKHLRHVESQPNEAILSLGLAVQELSKFHLRFQSQGQLEAWKRSLLNLIAPPSAQKPRPAEAELDNSGTEDEEWRTHRKPRVSSGISSWGAGRSGVTAPTEYTNPGRFSSMGIAPAVHVPIDLVVVIPVSSSMTGVKINQVRDTLRFMVQNLGERDRMGLVTFGSSQGGVPLVGMTTKAWTGWNKILASIRAVGQKILRADVVEGANVAMDLLMQRKSNNPVSSILLISDSSTTDGEGVDFVTSRAEAAKVGIHSFGLGMTHNPTTMIDLSNKTKASYTYVKDWMMLRECLAGCLGALQTTSHQNTKLRMRLPEGSPAKFHKIQGALTSVKRLAGREAECSLGDLRFGDKRDILVQLLISPDNSPDEQMPQDQWESIISGLEALGGNLDDNEQRAPSVEEVPLLQAEICYGDIIRDCASVTTRPSLLTITMLPMNPRAQKSSGRPPTPPIPPHTSIVQRRMELLTSDMLSRGLYLVSRGQSDRAQHLLNETRTILKGLAKGGLPPIPPPSTKDKDKDKEKEKDKETEMDEEIGKEVGKENGRQNGRKDSLAPGSAAGADAASASAGSTGSNVTGERQPSPRLDAPPAFTTNSGIDPTTLNSLETELESALEWINHPAVFGRDSRKAVLQAIGVISSQRANTFRTPAESLWASRIAGTKNLTMKSREWKEIVDDESLAEDTITDHIREIAGGYDIRVKNQNLEIYQPFGQI